ncbi:HNH endonuclease [Corynebacterium testudinoris]|uniref:HNH endonuclease n=1 Tax=Corynebacterium testudinoris TaxID=136857 RepID=A0A0G3H8I5_9CORY|nr:HNH endonuclease signature motif containing protein [Corynebacterium testudinoris]AKK09654.1 HNH endonuclease [Corynebacterium testudinoris]MBX8996340.1 HNH endonuclease [Corynebacterium testudinoris]
MSIEIVYSGKPRALTLDPSTSLVEAHLKEVLARPQHYYAVSSPDDPVARRGTRMRQEDHELWQSVLPGDDDDVDMVLARLRRSLGRGDQFLMSAISAHHRLNELPQLKAVQEQHFHLDLPRLKVIDSVLCKADTTVLEHLDLIDTELAEFLTPTRANQILPTAGKIKNRLNAIITMLDDSISAEDPAPPPVDSVSIAFRDGRGLLHADLDGITAQEIDLRIRRYAIIHGVSQAEALVALIRGEGATNVTLNLYRASDIPTAPGWVSGVGYLTLQQTEDLLNRVGAEIDLDAIAQKVSSAYATPADIRSLVVGLDGTCAVGGCDTPGHRAQMDHRVNHADGGPTTAANLAALCVKHHAMKTDRRVTYVLDPVTRRKYFLFDDGSWAESEGDGPLAPSERRWLQTVSQRISKRRARIRSESQAQRKEQGEPEKPPPPSERSNCSEWGRPFER